MDDRLYRYLSGLLIKVFEVTKTNEPLQTTEPPLREKERESDASIAMMREANKSPTKPSNLSVLLFNQHQS